MSSQLHFGYRWYLSYGHLALMVVALAVWLFGYARKWSKAAMILIGAVTLWSFAGFLVARFGLNANGRLPVADAEIPYIGPRTSAGYGRRDGAVIAHGS